MGSASLSPAYRGPALPPPTRYFAGFAIPVMKSSQSTRTPRRSRARRATRMFARCRDRSMASWLSRILPSQSTSRVQRSNGGSSTSGSIARLGRAAYRPRRFRFAVMVASSLSRAAVPSCTANPWIRVTVSFVGGSGWGAAFPGSRKSARRDRRQAKGVVRQSTAARSPQVRASSSPPQTSAASISTTPKSFISAATSCARLSNPRSPSMSM